MKPAYNVPNMAEIAALPWNGFKVASTFSGAGGSCLGYRMAGFKVVWANEFVPMAQESYKANALPDCVLDGRDIKHIQPHDILAATGLKVGELDLFDGSPPCQAFSTAGKREKSWGKEKKYEHGATQKNETLFDEYIRLLRGLQPKVFVAENVSGLVKGTAKGMFLQILAAMKASGYRVTCRVLDAQWLGVPQQRQRTIFVGVRNDLNLEPVHPSPLPYRYSVRDAVLEPLRVQGLARDEAANRAKVESLMAMVGLNPVLANTFRGGARRYVAEVQAYTAQTGASYGQLRYPVRLWQGGADNWTPPVMAEQLAARLPQASVTVLPGLSHYSTLAAVLPQLLQGKTHRLRGTSCGHAQLHRLR